MTTTKHRATSGVLDAVEQRLIKPLVRDHRDLPAPFNVFGARLRAAGIRFRVKADQTRCGIELVRPKDEAKWARALARSWDIWQGTREVTA